MPQAEALNLLAITLMLGMSPPNTSATAQGVSAQPRPHVEALQVRNHLVEKDRSHAGPTEPTKITTPSVEAVVPAVVTDIPAAH